MVRAHNTEVQLRPLRHQAPKWEGNPQAWRCGKNVDPIVTDVWPKRSTNSK